MATPTAVNQLSLAPLGAGDLIDRAVRLYRRHFLTLIRIAAPPVLVTTLGSLMMTIGGRSTRLAATTVMLVFFGFLIWVVGVLLNMMVMGGAARNLITHLLWNEPFSARATYSNVRSRFGGLLGASFITAVWIVVCLLLAFLILVIEVQVILMMRTALVEISDWLAAVLGIITILLAVFLALLGFFFLFKFIAYVPQVLMIEGRGVFDSISRSFTLARGNLRRLMAMFLFYWFATQSALMILLIPLGYYGWISGVNISPWSSATWPTWYAIGYSVLGQLSAILLVPVWMLGLSLLYIDERVRQEGYDIELLAARQLAAPQTYSPPNAYYPQAASGQPPVYGAPPVKYYSPGYLNQR